MSVDGSRIDLGLPYPVPCADPMDFNWCYRTPLPPISPGSHTIQVAAYNEFGDDRNRCDADDAKLFDLRSTLDQARRRL